MKKRWMLAVVLAGALLTACATTQERFSVEPMGGYVETEINLEGVSFDRLFPHGDGSLDAIAGIWPFHVEGRVCHYYSPDGGDTWQERDAEGWMRRIAELLEMNLEGKPPLASEALEPLAVDMDEARNIYCILRDDSGLYRLMRVSPEGQVEEMPIPEWRSGDIDAGRFGLRDLYVEGDAVGLSFPDHVVRYQGKDFDSRISSWLDTGEDVKRAFFSPDGTVVWTGPELVFFDALEGREARRVRLSDWLSFERYYAITIDEAGAVYTQTAGGIERLAPGGATFETVLDGARYSFGRENCDLFELVYRADTDTFYVGYTEYGPEIDGGSKITEKLCRYTYDPELPLPKEGETADAAEQGIKHADIDDRG